MKTSSQNTERGFTLVEMTVVLAALVPILITILGTTNSVRDAVQITTHLSGLSDRVDQVADRFGQMMQKAVASTIKSRTTQEDIDAALIKAPLILPVIMPIPVLDQWIVPQQVLSRTTLQFYSVSTQLSTNTSNTVGPFVLEHIMSPGELRNGIDDDGDGLIDEGDLVLRGPDAGTIVLTDVEKFEMDVIGSLVILRIRCAKIDSRRRIHRVFRERRFTIRNN